MQLKVDNPDKVATYGTNDEEARRRQIQQKHNTICVGHHYIQETRRRQIQQNTQHNMCGTPLCAKKQK